MDMLVRRRGLREKFELYRRSFLFEDQLCGELAGSTYGFVLVQVALDACKSARTVKALEKSSR